MSCLKFWSSEISITFPDADAVLTDVTLSNVSFSNVIPTDPSSVKEELHHVRALMQLEQKEDAAQFKLKNATASIGERQRRGLT